MPVAFIRNSAWKAAVQELPDIFSPDVLAAAWAHHRSLAAYAPTPLYFLAGLSRRLGIGAIAVKDEGRRFGLKAFKALGASWAVQRWLEGNPGRSRPVFAAATDGNHGRGLAWAARLHGCGAVIHMPAGSAKSRVEAIRSLGARCRVTRDNYDGTVAALRRKAARKGWALIQDTAWPGYEEVPAWIMQGYATIVLEALEQAPALAPTHVFLQAGVGSFAAAVIGALLAFTPPPWPRFVLVEPRKAACVFHSLRKGRPQSVRGALGTIMAGLACGVPNPLAWPVLRRHAAGALSCPDWIAANGMRLFAAPCPGDPPIVSGESGAVPLGALHWLLTSPRAKDARACLELNARSRVFLINTEADTSPADWQRIVWLGAHHAPRHS